VFCQKGKAIDDNVLYLIARVAHEGRRAERQAAQTFLRSMRQERQMGSGDRNYRRAGSHEPRGDRERVSAPSRRGLGSMGTFHPVLEQYALGRQRLRAQESMSSPEVEGQL
jgi:hypothetical protein